MSDVTRYPTVINTRATEELRQAVARAADHHMTTPSEFVRRAVLEKLRADGIECRPFQPATAA